MGSGDGIIKKFSAKAYFDKINEISKLLSQLYGETQRKLEKITAFINKPNQEMDQD